jgi:membrane-associated phospholipid phosphatase
MIGPFCLRLRRYRPLSRGCILGLFAWVLGARFLAGCGTLPSGRGWGQDATLFPGWQRLGKAARHAAFSPETWAPATAALVLQIDDWDEDISEWAVDNTPIFGSPEDAEDASDYLRDATGVIYFLAALATPSGEEPKAWSVAKLKGLTVGVTAVLLTDGTTELLKNATDRKRPDGSDDESFPSGHTSSASAFTTLANRNLQSLSLSKTNRTLLRIGFTTLAAGTGWARVEAGRHYLSDVLVGYALGHFISSFFNDAFLAWSRMRHPDLALRPQETT